MPSLIRLLKKGERQRGEEALLFSLKKAAATLVPGWLGILLLAPTSIELIFGRGAFTAWDSVVTTQCLVCYAVGLLPAGLTMVSVVWFYAHERYTIPMWCSLGGIVGNVSLNIFFIYGMGWGVVSVALATAISMWGQVAAVWYFLYKDGVAIRKVVRTIISCGLCAAGACLIGGVVEYVVFGGVAGITVWREGGVVVRTGFLSQLAYFSVPAIPFFICYGALAWCVPTTELRLWLKWCEPRSHR
mgnify:CR=1 FL=1